MAFGFGLIHGFGYASGLADLGLPRGELLLALLLFNIGIEIGQDVFVFLVLALKRSFRQLEIHWPRWAVRLPGYAVGVAGPSGPLSTPPRCFCREVDDDPPWPCCWV